MPDLVSECGLYIARRLEGISSYLLLDAATGNTICETTFWINKGDKNRIRFTTGSGDIEATFSYPRYPSWFRRRWIECFDIDCKEVATIAESCGATVLVCYKPDMNCWHHLGVRASAKTMKAFDSAMKERGIPCSSRKLSWDIECPDSARWDTSKRCTASKETR